MMSVSTQQASHPSSGNNSGRGRNADSSMQAIFSSSFEAAELENNPKTKLYELFILIEKEFEVLYAENCALRLRLSETNEKLPVDSLASYAENTPSGFLGGAGSSMASSAANDLDYKSYGKKGQFGRQKWKTAFRGPSGRLVTSLKGSGHPDASKHRYVQNFSGHTDGIWHVTAANSGTCHVVASASADHSSLIWLANDARCVAKYVGHAGSVNSVAIRCNSDGSTDADHLILLTSSGDRQAHIWKANINHFHQSGPASSNSTMEENDVSGIGGGGGGGGCGGDSMIIANDSHSYYCTKDDDQQQQPFSPVTNLDSSSAVQIIQQPALRLTGHNDVVVSAEWMFGGEQLITASWDRTANVYDAESGKVINTLSGHDQELTHCNAHGSQKLVATASKDFTFRLWDFRELIQSVAVFQGHNDTVTSVAFASTHHIASASDDRTTKVWDLRNMRSPMSTIRMSSAVNTIAVSQNLIAIPQDGRHVSVYDIHGMRLARLPRASGKCHHRMICCAAWLPENSLNNLFTCGFDKQLLGWKFQLPK